MKNNKGSISILVIYLINILLYTSVLIKIILMKNQYYYNSINQNYDVFLIDNYISMSIYKQKEEVVDNVVLNKKVKEKKNIIEYMIELKINKDIINYYVIYDKVAKIITTFERF